MLVANLAGGGALTYLYLWTSADRGAEVAGRTVWLFALFPGSIYHRSYTESLFLLCAVGSMYHARRRQSLRAGLWMAAAIMTRSTGFILIPALILAARPQRFRTWSALLVPTCAAAGGYLAYLVALGFNPVHILGSQRAGTVR
jgi:Gpi18-like mannosyltransferase